MRSRSSIRLAAMVALMALATLACAGCGRDTDTLQPAPPNTDPIVFDDNYGSYTTFQAFLGSKVDAVVVAGQGHESPASLLVTVPGPGDPSGGYAGGAFTTDLARQLSGYDALTFWAKASIAAELDVAGLGNDNTGTSKYEAKRASIPLTNTWAKYTIPIPLPEKLVSEGGLFFFAEGPEGGVGNQIWFDDIRFESLGTISNPRPSLAPKTVGTFVGATVNVEGTQTLFDVAGTDSITIEHSPGYFTFASSNDTVATVVDGVIQVVGSGSATITAKLGTVDATGEVTVNATAPPATAPPTPTVPPADVISLFSNAYTSVTVDTWSADWDIANVEDARIASNDVKVYTNLVFAGIEFSTQTIDATAMTHFHLDVWVPAGTTFKVKLVDYGANGVYNGPGSDDREHELTFNAGSTPPLTTGTWLGLEIPLANFLNLTTRAHLAQLILSGDTRTAYVDNIYFHK